MSVVIYIIKSAPVFMDMKYKQVRNLKSCPLPHLLLFRYFLTGRFEKQDKISRLQENSAVFPRDILSDLVAWPSAPADKRAHYARSVTTADSPVGVRRLGDIHYPVAHWISFWRGANSGSLSAEWVSTFLKRSALKKLTRGSLGHLQCLTF